MGGILSFTPLDLVNLLLDFERFEVVELRLVRLELGVEFVFAALFLFRESVRLQGGVGEVDRGRWNDEAAPTAQVCNRCNQGSQVRTISFLSNNTTRPPLSPVAR